MEDFEHCCDPPSSDSYEGSSEEIEVVLQFLSPLHISDRKRLKKWKMPKPTEVESVGINPRQSGGGGGGFASEEKTPRGMYSATATTTSTSSGIYDWAAYRQFHPHEPSYSENEESISPLPSLPPCPTEESEKAREKKKKNKEKKERRRKMQQWNIPCRKNGTLHRGHQLLLQNSNPYASRGPHHFASCDDCQTAVVCSQDTPSFNCRKCDYDICFNCAKKEMKRQFLAGRKSVEQIKRRGKEEGKSENILLAGKDLVGDDAKKENQAEEEMHELQNVTCVIKMDDQPSSETKNEDEKEKEKKNEAIQDSPCSDSSCDTDKLFLDPNAKDYFRYFNKKNKSGQSSTTSSASVSADSTDDEELSSDGEKEDSSSHDESFDSFSSEENETIPASGLGTATSSAMAWEKEEGEEETQKKEPKMEHVIVASSSVAVDSPDDESLPYPQRIRRFYRHYAPEKNNVVQISRLMKQWGLEKQEELFGLLEKKYGKEEDAINMEEENDAEQKTEKKDDGAAESDNGVAEKREERKKAKEKRRKKRVRRAKKKQVNKLRVQKFWHDCVPYNISDTPACPGPFFPDILIQILLFIPLMDLSTLLAASRVNRAWHFFTNYLPHWSYYQVDRYQENNVGLTVPIKSIKHHILQQFQTQRILLGVVENAAKKPEQRRGKSWGFCFPLQIRDSVCFVALAVLMFFLAWIVGYRIPSIDYGIGALAFGVVFALMMMAIVVVVNLGDEDNHRFKHFVAKRQAIFLLILLVVAFYGAVPFALLAARVRDAESLTSSVVSVDGLRSMNCSAYIELLLSSQKKPLGVSYYLLDEPVLGNGSGWKEVWPSRLSFRNSSGLEYLRQNSVNFHMFRKKFASPGKCNLTDSLHVAFYTKHIDLHALSVSRSFRGVQKMARYRTQAGEVGISSDAGRWYTYKRKRAWDEYHAFLLRSDMPETPHQGSARVDRLYRDRNILIMVGCILLFLAIIASSQLRRRRLKATMAAVGITVFVILSPLMLVMFGVLCLVNSQQYDPNPRWSWLMCGSSASILMLALGAMLTIWWGALLITVCCEDG